MNPRTRVKICGITREQDALTAVELGADAIGVILYPGSPRYVELETAKKIRDQIPAFVTLVGVFVDADSDVINNSIQSIGLDLVQLHGQESDAFGRSLNAPYIKAIRARNAEYVGEQITKYPGARALLLDPYVMHQHGGTGIALDSNLWPSQSPHKLILAGGLCPDNIVASVAGTRPYAVDFNSGVEKRPGIKDPRLIEAAMLALAQTG